MPGYGNDEPPMKQSSKGYIEIYRDEQNMLRARGKGKNRLLATYFETDIQEDEQLGEALLQEIRRLEQGESRRYETSGNGHNLVLTPRTATISSLFDDQAPARRLKLEDFRQLLTSWLTAVRHP